MGRFWDVMNFLVRSRVGNYFDPHNFNCYHHDTMSTVYVEPSEWHLMIMSNLLSKPHGSKYTVD